MHGVRRRMARLDHHGDLDAGAQETVGDHEQQRAGAGDEHPGAGRHERALEQGLGTTRCHHPGQGPPAERRDPVVGARRDDDRGGVEHDRLAAHLAAQRAHAEALGEALESPHGVLGADVDRSAAERAGAGTSSSRGGAVRPRGRRGASASAASRSRRPVRPGRAARRAGRPSPPRPRRRARTVRHRRPRRRTCSTGSPTPAPPLVATSALGAAGATQARTPLTPSTDTRQSWHAPMPQNSPRGRSPCRVRRHDTRPSRTSTAATVSPAYAVTSWPSTCTGKEPPGRDPTVGHAASPNRTGENASSGIDGAAPMIASVTSSAVAGASPMPAPS